MNGQSTMKRCYPKFISPGQLFSMKYLVDLKVPFKPDDRNASLDCLLQLAVSNHYTDKNESKSISTHFIHISPTNTAIKYAEMTGEQFQKSLQTNTLVTSLDSIDMNSNEFKTGVYQLATILGVVHHPDHRRVLKACSMVIVEKLSKPEIDKAQAEAGKIDV